MNKININNLSIPFLLRTAPNSRITSDLLEATQDRHEKENIIQRINGLFKDFILKKYDSKYHDIISKHWNTIFKQSLFNVDVSESDLLVCSCAQKVLKNLENIIVHIEPEGFFPFDDLELTSNDRVENLLKFLFHPIPFDLKLLCIDNLKAIFWRKDPILMGEIRNQLKDILNKIYNKFSPQLISRVSSLISSSLLRSKNFSSNFLVEILVEQILCLYSFVEPNDEEILEIPTFVNDSLKLCEYQVEKIKMASDLVSGSVEAFALNPLEKEISPILIFRGTPPNPTADGFFLANLSDYTPGYSVGEILYKIGKKQLHEWMLKTRKEFSNQKVKVIGHSLGGSLANIFAEDYPELTKVSSYDPAGLLPRHVSRNINGKMFLYPTDIVSTLNFHPSNLKMIRVVTDTSRNFYYAHLKPYGFEPTLFLRVNPNAENKRIIRKIMFIFHTIYSIPFFIHNILFLMLTTLTKKIFNNFSFNPRLN